MTFITLTKHENELGLGRILLGNSLKLKHVISYFFASKVMPLGEGSIDLSVTDLCLSPVKTAVASISISDIVTVELLVVDKV